jgi:pilus assembly protein Flp/PilA
MRDLVASLDRFVADESGATMVEYSILIGLITVVAIALIAAVGSWVKTAWTNVNATLAANPVAS